MSSKSIAAQSGKYQVMLPLSPDERAALKESIRLYGVDVAVVKDEEGNILDGYHRAELWQELKGEGVKLPPYPVDIRAGLSHTEKLALARRLNDARRHMTPEQLEERRKKRIERVVSLRQKGKSLRVIAGTEGVSLAQVRRDLEEAGVPGGTPERSRPGA